MNRRNFLKTSLGLVVASTVAIKTRPLQALTVPIGRIIRTNGNTYVELEAAEDLHSGHFVAYDDRGRIRKARSPLERWAGVVWASRIRAGDRGWVLVSGSASVRISG